jgi:hypothetical protein
MTASANRSEADETTTHPETPFYEKNQAELVLAQGGLFQQARSLNGVSQESRRLHEFLRHAGMRPIDGAYDSQHQIPGVVASTLVAHEKAHLTQPAAKGIRWTFDWLIGISAVGRPQIENNRKSWPASP